MRIAIASDHRGFAMKGKIENFLREKGHDVKDFGTYSQEPCDYPDYVYPASRAVSEKKVDRAILICYTGIGSCIVANKVKGVRAALVSGIAAATLTRKHNDSNVLVLASQDSKFDYVKKIIITWLKTEFEGGRHLARVKKIREIEERENAG
ncbi:MAG: ribose 5-phosphate isomerase B [Candidatus Omnitrophota bacterium]|nr:ribose 5-phosphate isomerase B [Candidatus Omnitrophota bacterium]